MQVARTNPYRARVSAGIAADDPSHPVESSQVEILREFAREVPISAAGLGTKHSDWHMCDGAASAASHARARTVSRPPRCHSLVVVGPFPASRSVPPGEHPHRVRHVKHQLRDRLSGFPAWQRRGATEEFTAA